MLWTASSGPSTVPGPRGREVASPHTCLPGPTCPASLFLRVCPLARCAVNHGSDVFKGRPGSSTPYALLVPEPFPSRRFATLSLQWCVLGW